MIFYCEFSARALHFWAKEVLLYSGKILNKNYLKRFLLILSIFIVTTTSTLLRVKGWQQTECNLQVVRFYPNPASSVITFDFQKDYEQGFSIQIFNAIMGRKMYELGNMPEKMSINLTDFSRGIYIYQIRDKSGRMLDSGKFQVAK
jgi:hypothetical protein